MHMHMHIRTCSEQGFSLPPALPRRYKSRRDVHVSCAEALTLEAQERWKALHNEVSSWRTIHRIVMPCAVCLGCEGWVRGRRCTMGRCLLNAGPCGRHVLQCPADLLCPVPPRSRALHSPLNAPIGALPFLQAIVDDISCVILHTCGLPPPERDCSVPRPLARAASCNDEANELYWKASPGRVVGRAAHGWGILGVSDGVCLLLCALALL